MLYEVIARLAELEETLALMDRKVAHYRALEDDTQKETTNV